MPGASAPWNGKVSDTGALVEKMGKRPTSINVNETQHFVSVSLNPLAYIHNVLVRPCRLARDRPTQLQQAHAIRANHDDQYRGLYKEIILHTPTASTV